MKNKLILWLVLLVIGFLAGLIPQYLKTRAARQELMQTGQQLSVCQAGAGLAELRDTAALLYLEATRKNYGSASEYANRLFAGIQQQAANPSTNSSAKAVLENAGKSRDAVLSALAKGDPGVVNELQPMVAQLELGAK